MEGYGQEACDCYICMGYVEDYPCDCSANREYCSADACEFLMLELEDPYAEEEEAKTEVQDAIPQENVDSATLPLWDLWPTDPTTDPV